MRTCISTVPSPDRVTIEMLVQCIISSSHRFNTLLSFLGSRESTSESNSFYKPALFCKHAAYISPCDLLRGWELGTVDRGFDYSL